jgi:hypothetical protein
MIKVISESVTAQQKNTMSKSRLVAQGRRCILKDCCAIADNTVLAPETVVPPFTLFGGNPGWFTMIYIYR